jgi:hypothetical protein
MVSVTISCIMQSVITVAKLELFNSVQNCVTKGGGGSFSPEQAGLWRASFPSSLKMKLQVEPVRVQSRHLAGENLEVVRAMFSTLR